MSDKKHKIRFDDPSKKIKRLKGYRLIVVDGKTFQWRYCSDGAVTIIAPDGTRMRRQTQYQSYEYDWCEYTRQIPVTPKDIAYYARSM